MNLSKYRTKVRIKFPAAHVYKWGPRQWCVYAAEHGPFAGIAISGTQASEAAAWIKASTDPMVTGKNRRPDEGAKG